jgi:hypothetical protein
MPVEVIEIPCERLTRRKAFDHITLAPEAIDYFSYDNIYG